MSAPCLPTNCFATFEARKLLGGIDTLERLRDWKAPIERLRPEYVALLSAEGTTPSGDET
jgi:hypothetical protein